MANRKSLFTSESVTEGHPDKICDQISDAVLDAYLQGDKTSRVACETLVNTGVVMVAGEITSKAFVDIPDLVRKTIHEIGYTDSSMGFDYKTCSVLTSLDKQSPDISWGVNEGEGLFKEQGGLHHSATDYEDDFDRKVDTGMREKLQNEEGIF